MLSRIIRLSQSRIYSRATLAFKPPSQSIFIQTETTPNEHSLKFKPGTKITDGGIVEVLNASQARQKSALADDLFRIEGIRGIMFGPDFITVTKAEQTDWKYIRPAIFAAIMDYLSTNQPILRDESATTMQTKEEESWIHDLPAEAKETVLMIKEILDARIRPTVQDDGGDVRFVGFRDGVVELSLRGACRTCTSSMATLKIGIENMLMHYVPEVKEVRQVEDPVEKAAREEFEKFESGK